MNCLSCPSESNNKHGRLREGYMGEQCWTLDGEHINQLNDHNIHVHPVQG